MAAKGPMRSFGRRLQELRGSRNVTQKELADLLGLHVMLVSRYERGMNVPSAATIVQLARILHVSTDELLTGDATGTQPPAIQNAALFDRFRRIDQELDDRKELDTVLSFLDAFLAKKQLKKLASSA
jgi:transcriptional regulator with XRE-family HTH domain